MSKEQDFIDRIAPIAVDIAAERKANGESYIPPSYFVAKLALESGWGTSDKSENHNYGGLKSGSGRDTPFTTGAERLPTWEEVNGKPVRIRDDFQTFETAEDGLRGIEYYLRNRGLYDEAFNHSQDPEAFARAVEAGGYATDSNRLGKIMDIMNNPEYNLRALDGQVTQTASARATESPSVYSGLLDEDTSPENLREQISEFTGAKAAVVHAELNYIRRQIGLDDQSITSSSDTGSGSQAETSEDQGISQAALQAYQKEMGLLQGEALDKFKNLSEEEQQKRIDEGKILKVGEDQYIDLSQTKVGDATLGMLEAVQTRIATLKEQDPDKYNEVKESLSQKQEEAAEKAEREQQRVRDHMAANAARGEGIMDPMDAMIVALLYGAYTKDMQGARALYSALTNGTGTPGQQAYQGRDGRSRSSSETAFGTRDQVVSPLPDFSDSSDTAIDGDDQSRIAALARDVQSKLSSKEIGLAGVTEYIRQHRLAENMSPLEMTLAFDQSMVGQTGISNNRGGIAGLVQSHAGVEGLAWCAFYTDYANDMFMPGLTDQGNPGLAKGNAAWAHRYGAWRSAGENYVPRPGDLVIYERGANEGTAFRGNGHIGRVKRVEGGTVHTIEGNVGDDAVAERTHELSNPGARRVLGYVDVRALAKARNIDIGRDASPAAMEQAKEKERAERLSKGQDGAKIILDFGHYNPGPGESRGTSAGGMAETDAIARMIDGHGSWKGLKDRLEEAGFEVIDTRDTPEARDGTLTLADRRAIQRRHSDAVYFSVHADASNTPGARFIYNTPGTDKKGARRAPGPNDAKFAAEMARVVGQQGVDLHGDGAMGTGTTYQAIGDRDSPSVYFEMGALSRARRNTPGPDFHKFNDPKFYEQLGDAVVKGFEEWYGPQRSLATKRATEKGFQPTSFGDTASLHRALSTSSVNWDGAMPGVQLAVDDGDREEARRVSQIEFQKLYHDVLMREKNRNSTTAAAASNGNADPKKASVAAVADVQTTVGGAEDVDETPEAANLPKSTKVNTDTKKRKQPAQITA